LEIENSNLGTKIFFFDTTTQRSQHSFSSCKLLSASP
jgi:hypothetical protein